MTAMSTSVLVTRVGQLLRVFQANAVVATQFRFRSGGSLPDDSDKHVFRTPAIRWLLLMTPLFA